MKNVVRHLLIPVGLILCLLSSSALALEVGQGVDWTKAKPVGDGLDLLELSYDQPRLVKAYLLRADLSDGRFGFVGTGRCGKNWGEPMPEVQDRFVPCRTERQTTADFMAEKRNEGFPVVVAINTSPWSPWNKRTYGSRYADPSGLNMSGGEIVSWHDTYREAIFAVDTNGVASIRRKVRFVERCRYDILQSAFAVILEKGKGVWNPADKTVHPRMAIGLSADSKTFYALAVDGRQPEWSIGATLEELSKILLAAGATDALNMDGGGSTTLLYWDESSQRQVMANRHDPERKTVRRNALNLGIYRRDK